MGIKHTHQGENTLHLLSISYVRFLNLQAMGKKRLQV